MVSIESLLQPIREDEPSGENLRYDRVFDQIVSARAEEDETLPTGSWERQAKRADVSQVIALADDALRKRSKDLWLAAWLGEARIRQEQWKALPESLHLLLRLQEEFWDSLYPEIEEGDLGLRTAPLQWAMKRYAALVYELPITEEGFGFHTYQAARLIGYQAEAEQNEVTLAARSLAIEQGKLTPEDLDLAFAATKKSFYVFLIASLADASEALHNLYLFCEERFGDEGPSFVKIRTAVDEVGNLASSLLRRKRELEPDPVSLPSQPIVNQTEQEDAPELSEPYDRLDEITPHSEVMLSSVDIVPAVAGPELVPEENVTEIPARQAESNTPDTWDSAVAQVQRCADFMFSQQPDHPTPYLLINALMSSGTENDSRMVAPSSETRLLLKQASDGGGWESLLQMSMTALAMPYGPRWLDLHRYLWLAGRELGYGVLADSVRDNVRAMCRRPEISLDELLFEDDTPIASKETQLWLERDVLEMGTETDTSSHTDIPEDNLLAGDPGASTEPRAPEEELLLSARELAARGDLQEALRILSDDTTHINGRILFQRKLEMARLCLEAGQSLVAEPLLRRLLIEADDRHLAHWEGSHPVGSILALLLRSTDANRSEGEVSGENRSAVFARLCAIDAATALAHTAGARHG